MMKVNSIFQHSNAHNDSLRVYQMVKYVNEVCAIFFLNRFICSIEGSIKKADHIQLADLLTLFFDKVIDSTYNPAN